MKRLYLALIVALMISPAFAGDLNYNYIQGGFQTLDLDDDSGLVDDDGSGFAIRGSVEIAPSWYLFGSYGSADLDSAFLDDIDFDELTIGGGYYASLSQRADVFAELAYVSVEVDAAGLGSEDDNGFGARVGVRGMVSDRVELLGAVRHVDLDAAGDGTSLEGEAWYAFTEQFSLGVSGSFGDDVTVLGINGRLYFGR